MVSGINKNNLFKKDIVINLALINWSIMLKNFIQGFVLVFTFGMILPAKKTKANNIPTYWFKTGDYINKAFRIETSK